MKDKLLKERQEIIDVMRYRDGDYYVGGMATAHVYGLLGFRYADKIDFKKEIEQADSSEIRRIHVYLSDYISYMKKNPVRFCPCCKQQITNEY